MSQISVAQAQINGGDLLAATLKKAGVRKAFTLHGGHLEALFKGCVENGIDLVDFRHEAAAGHAADAYARTTGELGVCIITAGPGFANAISAIVNAKLDGSPVLFIIGAPPIREMETNPLQGGIDQIAIARPAAKWAVSVLATERMQDLAAMAIRKALTGPMGPVVLEVPIDILHMSVAEAFATPPAGLGARARSAPAPEEADKLVDLLFKAERPILIAGLEAASDEASAALRRLLEKIQIPVFYKTAAAGVLPVDHGCDAGDIANLAAFPILGIPSPDLVILLGARMGLLLGGRSGQLVPDGARLAQIHTDASEIGRLRDVDVAIAAHAKEALDAIALRLGSTSRKQFSEWCSRASSAKGTFAMAFPHRQTPGGIHPWHAAASIAEAGGPDACYVLDGGEAASWMAAAVQVNKPGRVLTHGYLGCLGIGPGFAVGAQLAHPEQRIIHVTGDGAVGFHIQELDTMVRHRLPIINVVMNNQVWGMSIHGQQMMYGSNYNVITTLGETCYASVASAFGCHSERVVDCDEIVPAMQRALDSKRPALIEVMIDPGVVHPVTIGMLGQVEEGSRDVMIPYYENIPSRFE